MVTFHTTTTKMTELCNHPRHLTVLNSAQIIKNYLQLTEMQWEVQSPQRTNYYKNSLAIVAYCMEYSPM